MTDTLEKSPYPQPPLSAVRTISLISSARRCALRPALDASEKFLHLSQGFTEAFSSAAAQPASAGLAGGHRRGGHRPAGGVRQREKRKEIPQGHAEYGSARWSA